MSGSTDVSNPGPSAAQQRLVDSRAQIAHWLEHSPQRAGSSALAYAVQIALPLLSSPQGRTGMVVLGMLSGWARKHPKATLLTVGTAALMWWWRRAPARSSGP
jgi:hypothetical protein